MEEVNELKMHPNEYLYMTQHILKIQKKNAKIVIWLVGLGSSYNVLRDFFKSSLAFCSTY